MADPDLFVICNNCGSEVSPYVTECPYCGQRLRKRAPDLKKDRKDRERQRKKQERDEQRRSRAFRSAFEPRFGRGGAGAGGGAYLSERRFPPVTTALIVLAAVASLALLVDKFPQQDVLLDGPIGNGWWKLVTTPFFHAGYGYAFVALTATALFGSGLERRFGWWTPLGLWLVCGAIGATLEALVVSDPFAIGAGGIAAGMMTAWLMVIVAGEDLRDYDALGLAAISALVLALPLATYEASVWSTVGGVLGGALVGSLLQVAARRRR